ncbi:MAG: hypothetical protein Q8O13_07115 [Candidatus Omnitrophota bacterium]|nr:hypothetical protein [Candidatus Omnitrophota bacterium]
MKPLLICFLIFIAVISSVLSWHNMIYQADSLPSFYKDEVANVQDAVSFFANGVYKNDRYGLAYTSGIAVTWPSAIGWYIGHNMLASRLACAFFSWLFGILLGFWFFRRNKYTSLESITAAVCLWGLTITTPFALPYWFGFMYNLGELNTIILIVFGLFLLSKHPMLSTFIFGISLWQGKFIYSPLVWAILLGNIFSQKLSTKRMLTSFLVHIVVFLLPLFIWMGWIFLRFDILMIKQWLFDELSWLNSNKAVHAPAVSSMKFSLGALKERLSSSDFEWVSYTLGTKMKNLWFSFGAIGATLMGLIMAKKKILSISDREKWISIMASIGIGFYSVLYFFIRPYMWQRYFHPAIYTGFGLFVFWFLKWIRKSSLNLKPLFYAAAFFLIILQGISAVKHPILQPKTSYARSCTDLYSAKCDPTLYK